MLLVAAMKRPMRILCAREIQKTITASVHHLLKTQIEEMGIGKHFKVLNSAILGINGSQFLFCGLRTNVDEIKSMENIDVVWVEEAQAVSESSWSILIPTIRKNGSEIWVTFNPMDEADPTYKRFVLKPPPGCVSVEINWPDNNWFPDTLKAEKDYDYSVDPEAAAHIWEGKTRKLNDAQVLRGRWIVEDFEPQENWGGPYQGADWGFAVDPAVMMRCWDYDMKLWIEYEAYGVGVDIDQLPVLFGSIPKARDYVTRADSSRPDTINYVKKTHEVNGQLIEGFSRLTACPKRHGSIEDGVEFLRSYKQIIIHPRCKHTIQEAYLYSYKRDPKSGDILPIIIDRHNDCMDSIRYALFPLIYRGRPGKPIPEKPKKRHDYDASVNVEEDWKTV